jgi:hypothetical protein
MLMQSVPSANYIDNFEDGDAELLRNQGRTGRWFALNDGTGVQTPEPGKVLPQDLSLSLPNGGSTKGMHMTAQRFSGWGAVMRADFDITSDSQPKPYNLLAFRGVAFWARVEAGSRTDIRFDLPGKGTHDSCSACNDHFGIDLEDLTTEWRRYCLTFKNLRQMGFGDPQLSALDLTTVYGVQFRFETGPSTDVWVDSMRFF